MVKYIAVVGGALAVLLLMAGWSLPELPDRFSDRPNSSGVAAIRIASARKWPEKVVLDTSQPTFFPPSIDVASVRELVDRLPDDRNQPDVAPQANVTAEPNVRPAVAEYPSARARHRRSRAIPAVHAARIRSPNELRATVEACCWFERMARPLPSRPASQNRVVRHDSWTGWHFPETD